MHIGLAARDEGPRHMTDETWSRNGSGTPDDGPTARPAEPLPAYIAKAFALLAARGLAADDVRGIQDRQS
jgi:hypothetical protein